MQEPVPLVTLEEKDKDFIASFLDTDGKWAMVAHELSVSSQNIGWLRNRVHPRGSNTLMLLEDLSREEKSIEDLIEAIKKCGVLPVETYLCGRYPVIKENFLKCPEQATPSISNKHLFSSTFHSLDFTSLMFQNALLIYGSSEGWEDLSSLVRFLTNNKVVARLGVPKGESNENVNLSPHNLMTHKQFKMLRCPILVLVTPSLKTEIKNLALSPTIQEGHRQQENQLVHDSSDPPLGYKQVMKLATDKEYRKQFSRSYLVVLCKNACHKDIPGWLKGSKSYRWNTARAQLLWQVCNFERKPSRQSNYKLYQ